MTREDAIRHYGSAAEVARVLGISRAAVTKWGDDPIPEGSAYKLQALSSGALRVNPEDYARRPRSEDAATAAA